MANIVGTILKVKDFYSVEEAAIRIHVGTEKQPVLKLDKDRKYIIPDFQREIRWERENVIELMTDIKNGSKFLGNVILTKTKDGFEIIDGQQRTTVINILLQQLRSLYSDSVSIFETCELVNRSFEKYSFLQDNNFNLSGMSTQDKLDVLKSDKLNQIPRYQNIWKFIEQTEILKGKSSARAFLSNLEKCELNVIVNLEENEYGLEYFLDVNLKGVRLDPEDIFKGYLFIQDNSSEIRALWNEFKYLTEQLKMRNINYPLLKLLEQGLYCIMYINEENRQIEFGEDFLLKKEIMYQGDRHYIREHIITVLSDISFMRRLMTHLVEYIKFILCVIDKETPDKEIKDIFKENYGNIDNKELKIIHNFIKKTIMDSHIVPKILIMKYYFNVVRKEQDGLEKKAYKRIYTIYTLSVLFVFFATEKNKEAIYGIVKSPQWFPKCMEQIEKYFHTSFKSESKMTMHYKYAMKDDDEDYQFRCKSLATIYNFFSIKNEGVVVKDNDKVLNFISSDAFTTEHFIMNKSKKCIIRNRDQDVMEEYPKEVKKYIDSMFNFIFITEKINSEELDNKDINQKLEIMDKHLKQGDVQCEYSRMIIYKVKKHFKYPIFAENMTYDDILKDFKYYYLAEFKEQYRSYVSEVIDAIYSKLKE